MDLAIKDVVELLNVSESTLKRWISQGNIPCYKLNNEYRFSRSEIEGWLLQSQPDLGPVSGPQGGLKQFSLFRAIHKGGVFAEIEGNTKEKVIKNAIKLIAPKLQLDPYLLSELLLEREKLMSTGLSHGIAVPHTREISFDYHYDAVSVVFPKQAIDWDAIDEKPVHTLFFLFACDDKRHLQILSKIAHLSRESQILDTLQKHPSKTEVLDLVRKWESGIKALV